MSRLFNIKFLLTLVLSGSYLLSAAQEVSSPEDAFASVEPAVDSFSVYENDYLEASELSFSDSLLNLASGYLGCAYKGGGMDIQGFDCSGFTSFIFAQFDIKIPHTSSGQANYGEKVPKEDLKKGDLVFFKGSNRKSKHIGHVGIIISEPGEQLKFIHASVRNGICINTMDSPYYKARYVTARRLR